MTFDCRKRTTQPLRQCLQALVGVGVAQPDHLAVVDLPVPTRGSGESVEVFRSHRDVQHASNLGPLWRRSARDIARNVVLNDRLIEAVDDQRAIAAGSLRGGDQRLLTAPPGSRGAGGQWLLQELILEDGG